MVRIKSFTEFITEELKDIITDVSRSGRTKNAERIWTDPTSAKSPSSATLLKNDLRSEEFNDIIKNISNKDIKKMLSKHKNNPKVERLAVTLNNIEYLKDKLKERGELRCEYCNKGPLIVYDIGGGSINTGYLYSNQENIYNTKERNKAKKEYISSGGFEKRDGATADHRQPQSKGGDKFSYNNLAVCCYWCNQKKGSMSYEDWMSRIKKPVLESALLTYKKIEREEIDNLLLDLKDNFPQTTFLGYGGEKDGDIKYLNSHKYQLNIFTERGGMMNSNPMEWSALEPYLDEFVSRVSEIGLVFKKCVVYQEVDNSYYIISGQEDIEYPEDEIYDPRCNQHLDWESCGYKDIPEKLEYSTGRFSWVTVDFYITQESTLDFVKDIFRR